MDSSQFLAVKVADQTYGIPIEKVEHLLDCSAIRPPRMSTPAWFLGVIELRGETVPVIDLGTALRLRGLAPAHPTLVIVRAANRPMGVVVDATAAIHESEVIPWCGSDGAAEHVDARYFAGFARQARIPVLDVDSTFACGDMAPVRKALGNESRPSPRNTFA